jgi:hypothetical protein
VKKILCLLLVSLIFFSCKKDQIGEPLCFDGIIQWAGDPAADGLGWVIMKDDSTTTQPFIPRNLSEGYKIDQLKVAVCLYKTNEDFMCECVRPIKKFHIQSIRRR